MRTLARFTQQKDRPARHNLTTMTNKRFKHLLKVKNFWLAINQRDYVNTKYALHLSLRIEIVQHNLADFSTLDLYNYP